MLMIISDLHLTDGTSGETIRAGAFRAFRERLRDLAYDASRRTDGSYRPVERVDVVLLGDILDVIRSWQWRGAAVRPWDDDREAPEFTAMVGAITDKILAENQESLAILKSLHDDPRVVTLPEATAGPNPEPKLVGHEPGASGRVPVEVHLHYMVGNHDWFYHLPGPAYDGIRGRIVDAMGLSNPPNKPFPHDPGESPAIQKLLQDHGVFARHGDIYDEQNFDTHRKDRDRSSIGDAIVIDLLGAFSKEVQDDKDLASRLPKECLLGLREIDNVRPLSAIPTWVLGLLHRTCANHREIIDAVTDKWNKLADAFLEIPFVKEHDRWFHWDFVDMLQTVFKISKGASLDMIARAADKWSDLPGGHRAKSFSEYALKEEAFTNWPARFVVYGHTHRHEVVALDSCVMGNRSLNQMYLNSGTWRRVHEPAQANPKERKFLGYYVMTYLTFYKGDERGGRSFESWSGSLGE